MDWTVVDQRELTGFVESADLEQAIEVVLGVVLLCVSEVLDTMSGPEGQGSLKNYADISIVNIPSYIQYLVVDTVLL